MLSKLLARKSDHAHGREALPGRRRDARARKPLVNGHPLRRPSRRASSRRLRPRLLLGRGAHF